MKFSLSWLKDHLDTDASLDEIVAKLNAIGLEVDTVENPAEKLGAFTVAEVLSAEKHPDADKLKVCKVSNGTEEMQIVCGAPNARTGIKVVLGRPGDYVPGLDVTLKKAKIRGVESIGMMCSAKELELGDDHDGIIELPEDAPVGTSYVEYAQLDDPVIDIEITPNRQDCLGVYGIARDLAAAGLGTLKPLAVEKVAGSFESDVKVSIDLPEEAKSACTQFLGRRFKGVKNGPSPQWLQDRLKAIGLRPISKLVDVTNYITHDLGRPLHVYDANKLNGDLQARLANAGETFTALDDKEYTAKGGETVIADASGPQGFGGIIGGLDTGCADDTTDVVLEAALFDPKRTAFTGRDHGLITDARYRFERGVDELFIRDGMEIATRMILDLCGGEVSHVFEAGQDTVWNKTVPFRSERVQTLGGLDLPASESVAILEKLGFKVEGNDPYTVHVPSWRVDVEGEPDIVEEVLRIHGLDNIPSVALPATDHKAGTTLSPRQKRARAVKRRLAGVGMHEAVTWSFMTRAHAALFGGGDETLVVDNPISSELDCMRPSILPNLMQAAQRNRDRGADVVALFEVGPVYENDTEKGQLLVAAGLRAGRNAGRHWAAANRAVDVFDAKRDALAALEAVGAPANLQVFDEAPGYYHPGRSGTLRLGPKNILASFGELHPKVLKALDVDGPVVGFEVYLDRVPTPKNSGAAKGALTVSKLQSVERDFAFLMDRDAKVSDLVRAVQGADKAFIADVGIFDVYEGKGVPEGQKSIAVSVLLEPKEETFTEKDIEAISSKVCAAAEKAVGAVLRG
ncbi:MULTISPECIES: phenylalanine--tRNA ligase subunit beta [Kordiimonas]|jgi:phenylalanyl-tRNA synthetase beta chain|uniref:Phenylalanine--tRNA ligase beta subunit n=1 Tax=Kordiimonas lacus TaxID=637679 RepID=A0A1G6T3N0_9PROT|nr:MULTISPECIES: phenylalanine--tRNA ligase subunit beta [Kordiimonas]SDD23474.1 phenylalanyl-tRNA synthetase beta subunit [Kordiimonas lacus]